MLVDHWVLIGAFIPFVFVWGVIIHHIYTRWVWNYMTEEPLERDKDIQVETKIGTVLRCRYDWLTEEFYHADERLAVLPKGSVIRWRYLK